MTTARAASAEQTLPVVVAMHRLLRGLRRAGSSNSIPPTQLIVLALLNQHGPLRIGELAHRIPCSQPTATTVVAAMNADGYVHRTPDPTDGRAIRVAATDEGLETLRSIAVGEAEVLANLLAGIPHAEREAFLAAAPIIGKLADRPNAALDS
ncbi:MAG TPA: MarR family transcriptional regulator [Pseudonocardia sp.]|nr:MarR family transcriptional regulator [Pseudonocardia sp.]